MKTTLGSITQLAFMQALPFKPLALWVILLVAGVVLYLAAVSPGTASVRLTVTGFITNKAGAFAMVQLTNSGPLSVTYWGYETNLPWYGYTFQTAPGPSNHFQVWPGPNYRHVLRPGQTVDFQAQIFEHPDYQILLPYTRILPLSWTGRLRAHAPGWIAHLFPTSPAAKPFVAASSPIRQSTK